jgi:hypothetical protein
MDSQAQKTTTETLEQRVTAVQAETKLLPAPHPAVQKAIEAGQSTVTGAVEAGIAAQENPIVAMDTGVSSAPSVILPFQTLTFLLTRRSPWMQSNK